MKRFLTAIMLILVIAVSCKKSNTANDGGSSGGVVEPKHYSIDVLASPTDGGAVTGGGDFEEGRTCTVSAIPATGYTFTNWTENGDEVAVDADYTFVVSGDRSLVANFISNGGGSVYFYVNIIAEPEEFGSVTGGGRYQEGQSCTVTASPGFVYIFTNWTENDTVVSDSFSYTFDVTGNRNLVANFALPAYVDLSLPSGTLWASCNLGANMPDEYGDYFAWGETEPKGYYDCDNYRYCHGCDVDDDMNYISMTKYCTDSYYGYNGFTDDLTILLPDDDAATVNCGEEWRMPTAEEWEELMNNTSHSFYTTSKDVNGLLLTATNGAKIFLPAAGFSSNMLWYAGSCGSYLTKSLDNEAPYNAWGLFFSSEGARMTSSLRFLGQSVRAVCSKR